MAQVLYSPEDNVSAQVLSIEGNQFACVFDVFQVHTFSALGNRALEQVNWMGRNGASPFHESFACQQVRSAQRAVRSVSVTDRPDLFL